MLHLTVNKFRRVPFSDYTLLKQCVTWGVFFWGYSVYSYSDLEITKKKEFQFRKEHSYMFQIWKRN